MELTYFPTRPAPAGDPRCIPVKFFAPLPVGEQCLYPHYPKVDQEAWKTLYVRQEKALTNRAADEFLLGLEALGVTQNRIPALADLSVRLQRATGWQLARAPGLLLPDDFFGYLARRVFPCIDAIRRYDELDYTPAPDCFHDLFGRAPMLMHPRFAHFYQKIGQVARNCGGDPILREALAHIYWFSVEYGLVQSPGGVRLYGSGIVASYGETLHSQAGKVDSRPMLVEQMAVRSYDVWHFQEFLFVAESFASLDRAFSVWAAEHGLL